MGEPGVSCYTITCLLLSPPQLPAPEELTKGNYRTRRPWLACGQVSDKSQDSWSQSTPGLGPCPPSPHCTDPGYSGSLSSFPPSGGISAFRRAPLAPGRAQAESMKPDLYSSLHGQLLWAGSFSGQPSSQANTLNG